MPENYIATLEELLNGDPAETLTERRHTSWYATPELSTEYRSADRAQDYTARLRRLEELSAEIDLKLSYLLED
jgi:hypothetical protein